MSFFTAIRDTVYQETGLKGTADKIEAIKKIGLDTPAPRATDAGPPPKDVLAISGGMILMFAALAFVFLKKGR